MKQITFEIEEDLTVTGRTTDKLTKADKLAIAKHLLNGITFECQW